MRAHMTTLHFVGIAAVIVACGGDGGLGPTPISGTIIPWSEYNGPWTLTARDTAGCRQGAGFTVSFDIGVSAGDTTTGFGPSVYLVLPGSLHVWRSDSLTGPLGGALARRLTDFQPQATVVLGFATPKSGGLPMASFQGIFDRQRTVTGALEDLSISPIFSSQPCTYPAVALKQ